MACVLAYKNKMSRSPRHVENLSNYELFNELKKCGFSPGPVVQTTRNLYIKKLIQLWDSGCTDQLPVENRNKPSFEEEEADFTYVTKQKTVMEEDRKVRDFEVSPGARHLVEGGNVMKVNVWPQLDLKQTITLRCSVDGIASVEKEWRMRRSPRKKVAQGYSITTAHGREWRRVPCIVQTGRHGAAPETSNESRGKKGTTCIVYLEEVGHTHISVSDICVLHCLHSKYDPYEALEEEAREVLRKLEGREEQ
ncbi:hypothetical protein C0J52_05193 [Blattella germanica]|nr:hypothetical protein C0J52_05193 [Blattella germanica]